MRIKVVQIVSAAAIPVLAATSLPTWVAGGLGALIVVLESIQQLFQFHSNWTHYRSTSEALKHEKYLYLAHAGSYATAANPDGAAGRAHRGPRLPGARRLGLRAEPVRPGARQVAMAQRIFISYRRDDSRGYAGRLQGDLSRRYTEEHVFRDVEIPPGADFGEYITGLVDKCNVVLAIIGPGWLDARDREGERRHRRPATTGCAWRSSARWRATASRSSPCSSTARGSRRARSCRSRCWRCAGATRSSSPTDAGTTTSSQLGKHLDVLLRGTSALHVSAAPASRRRPTAGVADADADADARAAPAPEPADHTTFAVLAAAAVALLTAFPADLLARNLVDRAPLDRDDLVTVRDFVLEKAIFFGIAGALAALAVGFLSRRSREPIVSSLLGLGAGVVAGAVYAGAYAGLTLSSAEGTDTASTAVGMIAAGAFLGWAFGAERAGARLEASCAGPGRRAARGRRRRPAARLADDAARPPAALGPVRRGHRGDRRLRRPAHPARRRPRPRPSCSRALEQRHRPCTAELGDARARGEVDRSRRRRAPSASARARPAARRRQSRTGTTASTSPPRR